MSNENTTSVDLSNKEKQHAASFQEKIVAAKKANAPEKGETPWFHIVSAVSGQTVRKMTKMKNGNIHRVFHCSAKKNKAGVPNEGWHELERLKLLAKKGEVKLTGI
jgi:hypothetical protein